LYTRLQGIVVGSSLLTSLLTSQGIHSRICALQPGNVTDALLKTEPVSPFPTINPGPRPGTSPGWRLSQTFAGLRRGIESPFAGANYEAIADSSFHLS